MSGRKGRSAEVVRVLSILRVLEGRGRYTLAQLAEKFAVSTRTVRRHLHALESAGYAIGHDERGDGSTAGMWWLVR